MTTLSRPQSPNRVMLLVLPVLLGLFALVVFTGLMLLRPQPAPTVTLPLNWMADDSEVSVSLRPSTPTRLYAFDARPSQPTLLTLQSTAPTFAFAAQIKDDKGALVAQFTQPLQVAALALPPSSGSYQLTVEAADATATGTVVVAIGAAAAARSSPPASILNKAAPPCQMTTSGSAAALVRGAPSPDYEIIGTLQPGAYLPVLGRTDDGWLAVNHGERLGWLIENVTTLVGQCDQIPRLLNPVIPTASTDNDIFLLEVDRDGSSQMRDAISLPNGDASDLIWLRAINLYNQAPNNYRVFSVTLNCTGIGAEHLRWGPPYEPLLGCGDTVELPFLYEISQQPLSVVFEANSPQSYVEYMLTITSTSANPAPVLAANTDAVG
ncbi:MAG: SH3 domain-containing protein [Anaerolineae bacterium]|nr:SH3 domain-containing protein [Anaerolineae bacterium]